MPLILKQFVRIFNDFFLVLGQFNKKKEKLTDIFSSRRHSASNDCCPTLNAWFEILGGCTKSCMILSKTIGKLRIITSGRDPERPNIDSLKELLFKKITNLSDGSLSQYFLRD